MTGGMPTRVASHHTSRAVPLSRGTLPANQAAAGAAVRKELDAVETVAVPDAERELLARLKAGDDEAFEQLVREESRHLLAVARRFMRNDEDAQDIVQQAFLSAFRALPAFNGQCRLSTWLHRIAVNAALMKLRSRSRKPEESIEQLLPRYLEDGHHVEQFNDWTVAADTRIQQRQTRAQVRAAVDRLPEAYRTVLMLRDIEELDTEETATLLGISTSAVKTRLHRARQALAALLRPVFE